MTPQEITASLAAPYTAVVATISRNGMPRLTPNGYRYDRRVLTLITRTDRLKYLNLQRNNRIPVCIGDPPVASNDVVISGTATCTEHDIWERPAGTRPVAGAQDGSAAVDADSTSDRPADDQHRRLASRRGGDGARIELRLQHRLHGRQHDREVGRLAAGNHRIDGHLLDGHSAVPRR
jgi:Pyridoxamine 5'-phosphate oxidase